MSHANCAAAGARVRLEYPVAPRAPPVYNPVMDLDADKIDDTALALLALTLHDDYRAWKGFDWDVLGRLHDKGLIDDPRNRNKSIVFTQEGRARALELLDRMFSKKP